MKHSPVRRTLLAEKERKTVRPTCRGRSPHNHHPVPQYLFNKLNIIGTERSGLSEQINSSSVFPQLSWDKTCLSCLARGRHLPQNAATTSTLWANHQINPCLVSAEPKYAYKTMIRMRAVKKLHCAQQRGNGKSGQGCDRTCCPLERQMRVLSLLWRGAK